jgi:hypothetical protein
MGRRLAPSRTGGGPGESGHLDDARAPRAGARDGDGDRDGDRDRDDGARSAARLAPTTAH